MCNLNSLFGFWRRAKFQCEDLKKQSEVLLKIDKGWDGVLMRVQEISIGNRKAYLLLNSKGVPVVSVAKYMKHLYNKESKSNTLKTYCTALKHYFTYLQ